jgi:hypothetical protein
MGRTREAAKEKVSEESVGTAAIPGFGILGRGGTGSFRGPWKHLALQTRPTGSVTSFV